MKPRRLAERVLQPQLMAGLVLGYQRQHNLDDPALMRHLGIDADALARLVLERRPTPARKLVDVMAMAQRVGCPFALLWGIINEGAITS